MKHKKLRTILLILFGCIATAGIYCLISIGVSYYALSVTRYSISSDKTNEAINIVMVSDLHDSEFGDNNCKLIEKVKEQNPDLILVVGDMLSYYTEDYSYLETLFSAFSEMAPTYCSLGNHEVAHEEYDDIIDLLEKTSNGLLEYEYEDINIKGTNLRIGGLSLYYYNHPKHNTFVEDFANTDRFRILLHHQPEYYLWGIKNYDIELCLSGHTHGGQVILPFAGGVYAPEQGWWPEYDYGLFTEENSNSLIITRGLGSSAQVAPRFNNPPEIVTITLMAEE